MTGSEYAAERKRLRLSQTELAEKLAISRASVSRLEGSPQIPQRDAYALLGLLRTLETVRS